MPAARPPFTINILNRCVNMVNLTGEPGPGRGWSEIPCASRKAYGCGANIQEAVQGLVLYARLGDGPLLNSSLAIRMSEVALRRFKWELDPDYYRRNDTWAACDLIASACVERAEHHGVTVISLSIIRPAAYFYERPHLLYSLVYDAIGRSLSVFQILPDPCKGIYKGVCTMDPIVSKRNDGSNDYKLFTGGSDDYNLLFLGYEDEENRLSSHKDDVMWVGSLSSSSSDDNTRVPSKLKRMVFQQGLVHKPFNVDAAFSCQGKAFWADLKQGLFYYDLQTNDFSFVKLPCEYNFDVERGGEPLPIRDTRTMGCVGDSVWFVCIHMPSHYTNAVVRIWELLLPGGQLKGKGSVQWEEVVEDVPAKVLWELSSFKKAGLPVAPLRYPTLTPDGALCFVLLDLSLFPLQHTLPGHFCIFDMLYKRLLWHGRVHDYPITESVIMYTSSSFLNMKQCSSQRSSAEEDYDCAAGLEALSSVSVSSQGA